MSVVRLNSDSRTGSSPTTATPVRTLIYVTPMAQARRRVARGLPPERQPGEGRGDGDMQDDMEGLEVQR